MLRSLRFFFSSSKFTISIIGRPNVGKSSLFNKLHAGKDSSIVSPEKGVTRDRKEGYSELFKVPIRLVDTAGIEELIIKKSTTSLYSKMVEQTAESLTYSDLALFVIDGREGVTTNDVLIARWLRQLIKNQSLKTEPDKDEPSILQKVLQETHKETIINHPQQVKVKASVKRILLVANKCENEDKLPTDLEQKLHKLGLGEPVLVSALDGTGFQDLLAQVESLIPESHLAKQDDQKNTRKIKFDLIKAKERKEIIEYTKANDIEFDLEVWDKEFDQANPNPAENSDFDEDSGVDYVNRKIVQETPGVSSDNIYRSRPISISIVGRINMGKSTLVNKLIEQDRVVADSEPGTTRDPISVQWIYKGRKINLVDTAGIETDSNNLTVLQKLVKKRTDYALQYSNVVILLIDALGSYRSLDLALAQRVVKEGRGLVMAVNKWDLVEKQFRPKIIKYLENQLDKNLTEVQKCPLAVISAEQGANLTQLIDNVVDVYDKWNTRISTGLLNDWLQKFKKLQNLPISSGDRLKIRFLTQVKIRPPTFSIFINDSELFKTNYLKYLRQSLCKEFNLWGVPVRFILRDQTYQKQRKVLEKENVGKTVKSMFLRRRRVASLAKRKLEQLNKKYGHL